jgi:hypothetical protein
MKSFNLVRTSWFTLPVRALCTGTILLGAGSASAQNLYVDTWYFPGAINVVPPGGGSSTVLYSGGLGEPMQIAFDSSGNLYVPDEFGHDIYKFTPNGTKTTFAPSAGQAIGLAVSGWGTIYGTDYAGGNLYAYDSSGHQTLVTSGLIDPTGLAFDAAGDLFYASYTGNGSIYEFKNNNGTLNINPTLYATGLANPYSLAFDTAGDMYVTYQGANPGQSFGGVVEIAPGDASQTTLVTGLNQPSFIALDASGNFYVDEVSLNDVFKYAPNGTSPELYATVTGATGLAFQGMALPVPEPSTWALAGLGAAALLVYRRRRLATTA